MSKLILFGLLLFILCIPQLQQQFSFATERNLQGSYSPSPDVSFSKEAWFAGTYQKEKAAFLSESFGFRKSFVRGYNEFMYRCFSSSNAKGVVVGKSDVLYESWYIRSALGLDFIGEDVLSLKVRKLAFVRDTLEAMGKDLLVVLAPGKGTYFPDNYPKNWGDSLRSQTNHKVFSSLIKEQGIHLFDIKTWFINAKDTSRYPLFPKTGIHWSKYGEYLVMDSLIDVVGKMRGISMSSIVVDSVEISSSMQGTDDDIERSMNLIYDIPDDEMAYPIFRFEIDSSTIQPNVLTISDSFNWGIFNSGFSQSVYSNSEFWYYFEDVYPPRDGEVVKVDDLSLIDELKQVDAVIVMCTETNIYSFGFIEAAFDAYSFLSSEDKEAEKLRRIAYFRELIIASPEWYAKIQAQAETEQITVEAALQKNAEYMAWEETQ